MGKTKIYLMLTAVAGIILSGCNQTVSSYPPPEEKVAKDQKASEENKPIPSLPEEKGEAIIDSNHEQPTNSPNSIHSSDSQSQPTPIKANPLSFDYPDAVRGIYVTGHSAGGAKLQELISLIDRTDLNAMVIDIKDDYGNITYKMEGSFEPYSKPYINDPQALMKSLAEHKIYPIARIVVFKDSTLALKHPEFSFKNGGQVWKNGRGESFVNPFVKQVWEHNVAIAKEAARLGFQEIQFDYVRFPEGFEKRDKTLSYSMGEYTKEKLEPRLARERKESALVPEMEPEPTMTVGSIPASKSSSNTGEKKPEQTIPQNPGYNAVAARVTAVTDFVEFAKKELEPYKVKVSVDIFGYTATLPEAPGIGQNFNLISQHVDVISSMIYPSHWGAGYFKIPKPDVEPYRLVQEYVKMEKEKFAQLQPPPISRPWIQDFTATWLGKGNYISYGKREVELQIKALNEAGIKEFLVWNAVNSYTPNVDYTPLN